MTVSYTHLDVYKRQVEIFSQNPEDTIYYQILDSEHLSPDFKIYTTPFNIDRTSTIKTYVQNKVAKSNVITGKFFRKPNNYTIKINSKFNSQYSAGGEEGLIDGIYGCLLYTSRCV